MKKVILGILILSFILSFSSFILAADFPDLPEGHWSYEAVLQLARKGFVEGYPDGLFKGDKPASRYEMALVVARVISKVEQGLTQLEAKDRETVELINRLMSEFRTELKSMGIKISKIEDVIKKHEERIIELERVKFYVKNHSFFVDNNLSGVGQANASDLDMGLTEWGFGGNITVANGSVITRNTTFAINRAAAFTTNTLLGFKAKMKENVMAGADFEIYTRTGDSTAGRVFGVQLPYGNYGDGNVNNQPTMSTRLFTLWAEQKNMDLSYKAILGTFIPDIAKGEKNLVRLGSFFIRPPVTSQSILGHQYAYDKKSNLTDISGRTPVFGFEATGAYKNYDFNFFRGTTELTPITAATINDRQFTGGRIATKFDKLGIGIEAVGAYGNNLAAPFWQGENLLGVDVSYKFTDSFSIFGAVASSTYTRSDRTDEYKDGSYIAGFLAKLGFLGKFFEKSMFKMEYQRIGKDYEPLNFHKTEHYPRNYSGYQGYYKHPFKQGEFTLGFMSFEQIEPDVSFTKYPTRDAQNDPVFPGTANVNTEKGKGSYISPMIDYTFPGTKLNLAGYAEMMTLRRGIDAAGQSYRKRINRYSLWANYPFSDKLSGTLGFGTYSASGMWTVNNISYNFAHKQSVPKLGLTYKVNSDIKATLLYNWYNFDDQSAVGTANNNDWTNNQLLGEITLKF